MHDFLADFSWLSQISSRRRAIGNYGGQGSVAVAVCGILHYICVLHDLSTNCFKVRHEHNMLWTIISWNNVSNSALVLQGFNTVHYCSMLVFLLADFVIVTNQILICCTWTIFTSSMSSGLLNVLYVQLLSPHPIIQAGVLLAKMGIAPTWQRPSTY